MFGIKKKQVWPDITYKVEHGALTLEMHLGNKTHCPGHIKLSDLAKYMQTNTVTKTVTKTESSIWHVLGCMPTKDKEMIIKSFRRMSLVYHPDAGGSDKAFNALQQAKEKALKQCN